MENAHAKGSETSSILFSRDSQRMVTRGGDDTVKRKFIFVHKEQASPL